MANYLVLNQPQVFVGLGTLTYTIPSTALYSVVVDMTENPPSGLSIVVNNNGSPIYTMPALSVTQGAQQFKVGQPFAANDVVTVVISSSSAIDQQLNTVKTIVSLQQGL